jgi:outer membrane protein assembly factor BamB
MCLLLAGPIAATPALAAAQRELPPDVIREIEESAAATARAMRETQAQGYSHVALPADLESLIAEAWKSHTARVTVPCPSAHPHDAETHPPHLATRAPVDQLLHARGVAQATGPTIGLPGAGPVSTLIDSTTPPDDTLTTWIKVFLDLDGDGEYDDGESGIEGVQVSNGSDANSLGQQTSALTDADGTHTFDTRLWDSRFVMMTVPSGYTATTSFWHRLDAAVNPDSAYFGLVETPETADPQFRMVQMSDMQVGNLLAEGLEHGDDLNEIAELAMPPDFVVITGDLVFWGHNEIQFENYLAGHLAPGHEDIPVHHGYGDHDAILNGPVDLKVANFEEWIGPTCYSFEYGGIHFIMYNDIDPVSVDRGMTQFGWLFMDIVAARARTPDIPYVICKHKLPGQEELDLYNGFDNMLGVFSGHWHGSRVREAQGIFDVNTPPSRYGGIDKSSRGFRIVDFDGTSLQTQYREAGISEHARIAIPADGDTVLAGPITLLANVYASTAIEPMVEFDITGPAWANGPMTQQGSWSWSAEWDASSAPAGIYQLTVTVMPDVGAPYWSTSDFELVRGDFVAQPNADTDWPSYKFDAAGTGYTPETLVPPLRLLWAKNLGSPINVPSPAVAGGKVYIGTSNISTTAEAKLVCLEATTGATLWETPAQNDVKSTPAIHDDTVFFTNSSGSLFALDTMDGGILWQAQLGDSLERWEMTSPTYYDGTIYAGGAPAMSALDAATGGVVWQSPPESFDDFIPSTYSAPAVSDDYVAFASSSGLYVYDRLSGSQLWKVESASSPNTSSYTHRSAAIIDTLLFTAGSLFDAQRPRVYDVRDGTLLYEGSQSLRESTSAPVVGPTTEGDGWRMILPFGGRHEPPQPPTHGRMQSYVPPATAVDWNCWPVGEMISSSYPYKREVSSINSTAAWAGDYVYYGGDNGILHCVGAETGALAWSYDLGVPIRSSPAVAGNMLFVNGSDGTLYAFVSTFIETAAIGSGESGSALRTQLIGNWPNPFNPSTLIRFDLGPGGAAAQAVSLKIYDAAGRLVRTLVDDALEPGSHRFTWDGRNDAGARMASSVYFYELMAGEQSFRRKLVLAK